MIEVLYRKYRSKNFSEIIGQETVKSILINSILSDSISHAYLFSGPRGTGKTSIARIFSKAVNCLNFKEKGDVCNECENCLSVSEQNNVDVVEMDAASNRGIEEIRTLKENINYLPTTLKYKIYIIDEAHMLTKEAFNALLKTLEEPPAHVLFLLATTEPHKLPVTILSRVQRFDFSLVEKEGLKNKLRYILDSEGIKYEDEALDIIYDYTGGSFRDAESLLGKIIADGEEKITVKGLKKVLGLLSKETLQELTDALLDSNTEDALSIFDRIYIETTDVSVFIDQYLNFLKDLLIETVRTGGQVSRINPIIQEFIEIKRNLKSFDSERTLVQLSLVKLTNLNPNSSTEKILKKEAKQDKAQSSEEKGESVNEVKSKEKTEEIKSIDPAANTRSEAKDSDNSIVGIIDKTKLLELLRSAKDEVHSRLIAIVEASNVSAKEDRLVIKNKYKFNIKYLEKSDVKDTILNILKSGGLAFSNMIIEQSESDEPLIQQQETKGSTTQISKAQKDSSSKLDNSNNSRSAGHEELDNTELVESILG